jgi:hypothetical protein
MIKFTTGNLDLLWCDAVSLRELLPTFQTHLFFEMPGTTNLTTQHPFTENMSPQEHRHENFRARKSTIYNKSNPEYCNYSVSWNISVTYIIQALSSTAYRKYLQLAGSTMDYV